MKDMLVPWLASSFAFSLMFVGFLFVTWGNEHDTSELPSVVLVVRVVWFAFAMGLFVQLTYGGLVYLILTRSGLWNAWTVSLAYALPVAVIGWLTSDTTADIQGTIRWVVFALVLALVTWWFAPQARRAW